MTIALSTHLIDSTLLLEQFSLDEETAPPDTKNLSPISVLFPELLAAIFAFCICPRLSSIQCISQVSRHWREVAFAFPNLWSTITIRGARSPIWTEELFQRSKSANLAIYFDYGAHGLRNEFVMQALGQMERIKEIYIREFYPQGFCDLFTLLKSPAPKLSALSIEAPHLYSSTAWVVPDGIFAEDTPELRCLDLVRCHPTCTSPLLKNLTRLRIVAESSISPSLSHLVGALRRMPLLEELELINCLPPNTAPNDLDLSPPDQRERLHFPHLSLLHISSTVMSFANLLEEISFPVTARVNMRCAGHVDERVPECLPQFLAAFLSCRTDPQEAQPMPWLDISITPTCLILLFGKNKSAAPLIQLHLNWFYLEGDIVDCIFDMVYCIFAMAEVTDIQVTHEANTGSSQFLRSLVQLPNIRSMTYIGNPFPLLYSFTQVLSRDLAAFLRLEELVVLTRAELLDEDYQTNVDELGEWLRKQSKSKKCDIVIVERDSGRWEWAVAWKYYRVET